MIPISEGTLKGCMIPFDANQIIPGQLVQIAESYAEGENIGSGRIPVNPMMFVAIHGEGVHVKCTNLYRTLDEQFTDFICIRLRYEYRGYKESKS